MLITSPDNKKIKELIKLKQKKYRDQEGKFLIETENIIKEAYIEGALEEIYLLENEQLSFNIDIPITYVSESVMNKLKDINTSKVVGVCAKKDSNEYIGKRYLMLDKISDPGNLGTIIRSAVAFDIDTLIVSDDSCDIYNDKVLRATEGAIFKLNIIREDLIQSLKNMEKLGINVYGTDVTNGDSIATVDKSCFCIIVGNEGNGISDKVRKKVSKNIHLDTKNVESLNVAVATSIILYELNK